MNHWKCISLRTHVGTSFSLTSLLLWLCSYGCFHFMYYLDPIVLLVNSITWILPPKNHSDHQTPFIHSLDMSNFMSFSCCFLVHIMTLAILILLTLCKMKRDHCSFLNQPMRGIRKMIVLLTRLLHKIWYLVWITIWSYMFLNIFTFNIFFYQVKRLMFYSV